MLIPFTINEPDDTLIPESSIERIVDFDGKVTIYFPDGTSLQTKDSFEEFKKQYLTVRRS